MAFTPGVKAAGRTTYYISKNGNNADGLSWATAWNELNKINWSLVQPGDTLLLDGGSQSTTYTTTLTIGKSGTQADPIIVKRATDAGHNGQVILFGGRSVPLPYCGQVNYTYRATGSGKAGEPGNPGSSVNEYAVIVGVVVGILILTGAIWLLVVFYRKR